MTPLGLDSETDLIAPGLLAPPLICVSWCKGQDRGLFDHMHAHEFLHGVLTDDEHRIMGLNIAFDMAVVGNEYPDLLPHIFEAYWQGKIWDVGLCQRLIDIARGQIKLLDKKKGSYSLAGLCKRLLKVDLEKEGTPRLEYGALRGVPVADYTPEQVQYAELDAVYPVKIWDVQSEVDRQWAAKHGGVGLFADAGNQARHDFSAYLVSAWGVRSNETRCKLLVNELEREIDRCRDILRENNILRANGTKDKKAAQARMVEVMKAKGRPIPRTDKGQELLAAGKSFAEHEYVALDKDAAAASGDPVIQAYSTLYSAHLLRQRVKDLWSGAYAPLQPGFFLLKDTGRTSCRKPKPPVCGAQLQNMPKLKGSRECLEPREGYVFIGADIDAAEMHTLAQTLLEIVGSSRLAELLNQGQDPHVYFGGLLRGLTYEQVLAHIEKDQIRTEAKPGNFGIPGGMGPARFCDYAAGYNLDLSLAEAQRHIYTYKNVAYPEMVPYLKQIGAHVNKCNGRALAFLPWCKRWRGGMSYSAMANTFFQSRCADGALAAVSQVQYLSRMRKDSPLYGTRIWNFVHDELLCEAPIAQAAEAAEELGRVIGEEFNQVCPDVPTKAEPAIFWRWAKGTKPKRTDAGVLVPSDPENAPVWYREAA